MGLMKKLTSAVVASSLILGLVGTAFAAPSAEQNQAAFEILNAYKIVQGKLGADGTSDPALGDTLTRAELVTVIVRAFGQEETAKILAGASSFSDVDVAAWYSGYAALAKNIAAQKGITIGYEDGSFKPNQNVTMIEALAFVMKFLGVAPGTGATWVEDTVAAAKDAGIITAADAEAYLADPSAPATRGNAFGLAYAIFSTYQVSEGETVLTTYVDTEKPVLSVTWPDPSTTKTSVEISGKVEGAVALFLDTDEITTNEDGTFTQVIDLEVGPNEISFFAVDLAGNITPESFTVTRNPGVATSVEASLSSTEIKAGETADLTVKVLDENGAEVEYEAADISAVYGGEIGTFDPETGKFTASTKAGTGTVVVKYNDLSSAAIDVTVVAGDLAKVVADKNAIGTGEKAILTAQDEYGNTVEGATFSADSADAFINGNAFTAVKPNTYTVTATKGDKTATVQIGFYSSTLNGYKVTTSAPTLIANNASSFDVTIAATDANGNVIGNDTTTVVWGTAAASLFEMKNASGNWVALADVTLEKGTKTVTLRTKSGILGGQIATVAVNKSGETTLKGSATIELVDQVATSVKVSTDDKFVANNTGSENATFEVEVLDQAGEVMQVGAWAVKVSVSGPAVLVDSAIDGNPAATKDLVFTGGTTLNTFVRSNLGVSGTVTVTAVVEGLATTSSSASVTATAAQAASKLEISVDETSAAANYVDSDGTITFTLKVTDAQGVPIDTDERTTVTAKADVSDTAAGEIFFSTYTDADTTTMLPYALLSTVSKTIPVVFVDGVAKVALQADQFVGNITLTFADSATSGALTGGNSTVSFVADTAVAVGLVRHDTINVPATAPTTKLVAQLYDGAGNVAKVAGKDIVFTGNNDDVKINGGGKTATVTTDAEGKATVDVSVLGYVGAAYTYTVTVNGATGSNISAYYELDGVTIADESNVSIVPSNAVAVSITSSITNSLGNVTNLATAGDTMTLKVTPKDAAGKVLPGAEVITVEVTEGETVADVLVYDNGTMGGDVTANDGIYTGTFVPTKSGRLVLTVTDSSAATEVSVPVSLSVRAKAQSAVRVERADYTDLALDTTKGVAKSFRIIPVDEYDNLSAKTDGPITVTFTVDTTDIDSGKYFEIRSTADGANLISGGTATLTIPAGSTGVTFYVLSNDTTGVDVTVASDSGNDAALTFTAK